MRKKVSYILEGPYKAIDWMFEKRIAYLRIFANQKGLDEIIKDPLQDYTEFGVQETTAVDLEVFKVIVEDSDLKRVESFLKKPVLRIKKGEFTEEELNLIQTSDVQEVDYRL